MKRNSDIPISRRRALISAGLVSASGWLSRTRLLADEPVTVAPKTLLADETNATDQAHAAGGKALPYLDRLGLQLYTVRNQMAEAPEATLQSIAQAGYKQVELMSIDENAVRIAAMARDLGLMVHSGFLNWRCIATPADHDGLSVQQTIELAERIGLRHVVFGYIGSNARDTADKCRAIAERANDAAHKTRVAGMRMAYHNHSFEFACFAGGKKTAFDIFIERFDPQLMDFELDVFWAKIGGHEPTQLMRHLAGRISMLHLKDLKSGTATIHDEGEVPEDAFQECGDGVLDIPAIMRLGHEIGVRECHVEQDQSPAPLESIAQSFQYLSSQRS